MNCDPRLEGIDELIKELNRTNDLFKFVRIMREKFQAAASNGKNIPSFLFAALGFHIVMASKSLILCIPSKIGTFEVQHLGYVISPYP